MRDSKGTERFESYGWWLQADHCAEHEWGIKPLWQAFGIREPNIREVRGGIEGYRIRSIPVGHLHFQIRKFKRVTEALLYFDTHAYTRDTDEMAKHACTFANRLHLHGPYNPATRKYEKVKECATSAWSENAFIIRVQGPNNIQGLMDLHNAILTGDVGMWIGGAGPFTGGGLMLSIISKTPVEIKQKMLEDEKAKAELYQRADATGIPEALKSFGYISPGSVMKSRHHPKDRDNSEPLAVTTDHSVMFYFCPTDWKKYNSGWYTVEELQAFLNGDLSLVGK